jgi:hypothetical protein
MCRISRTSGDTGACDLTPVDPGRRGTFYFDLGTLRPGHYVVEVDFLAEPQAGESYRMAQTYVAGFVVGWGMPLGISQSPIVDPKGPIAMQELRSRSSWSASADAGP